MPPLSMHQVVARCAGRQRPAVRIAVEVNHIVVPAKDQLATAELLACVLGLEGENGRSVRSADGLVLEFSEPQSSVCVLQCAFLLGGAEFDAALVRIRRAGIDFYSAFDGKGRGELNRQHGTRGIYFNDPDNHLFELIEQAEASAPDDRIKAVAIKFS
jgi:catechol 2,3-dioxygenase-like lactoylglutathione lyase family enzyme